MQLQSCNELWLPINNIGNVGCIALARGLRYVSKSHYELLCSCRWWVDDDWILVVCPNNSSSRTLNFLDLSECKAISDAGAIALGAALASNVSLTTLLLGFCSIGDDGAAGLADGIRGHAYLRELSLGNNRIGDRGALKIADTVRHNKCVVKLWLNGNRISRPGLFALAASFRQRKLSSMLNLNRQTPPISESTISELHETFDLLATELDLRF